MYVYVQVEPYVMLRHSPLSAAATSGRNSSIIISSSKTGHAAASSVKPVQHHVDGASSHFEGFIVDLMDRIMNVRHRRFIIAPAWGYYYYFFIPSVGIFPKGLRKKIEKN